MSFPNQTMLAEKIANDWEQNPDIKKIAIVAECQSGKTGLLIELARRIKHIVTTKRSQNFKYFILSPSDKSLAEQTEQRFSDKNILNPENERLNRYLEQSGDFVFYPSNIHKLMSKNKKDGRAYQNYSDWNDRVADNTFFLFIHDEAHRDSGSDGKIKKSCEDFGIPALNTSDAENSLMIYVTATPTNDLGEYLRAYSILQYYMRPGAGYLSLEMLKNASRILPITLPLKDKKESPSEIQINQVTSQVLPRIRVEYPGGGHFIWRVNGAEDIGVFHGMLKNQEGITFCAFASSQTRVSSIKKYDIERLEDIISCRVDNINICFIIGSYRQGKTLEKLENVIGWYDSSSSGKSTEANDALVIQSIGRNCGYGKGNFKYKIWCNIESVLKAIEFYKTFDNPLNNFAEPGSSGSPESRAFSGTYAKRKVIITSEYIEYEPFDNRHDAERFRNEQIASGAAKGRIGRGSVNTISNQNKIDIADAILRSQYGRLKGKDEGSCTIVFVDGQNTNFKESWSRLLESRPQLLGKYIYAELIGQSSKASFNTSKSGYIEEL